MIYFKSYIKLPKMSIVKSIHKIPLLAFVFYDNLKHIESIDLEINRVCPFTMPKKCTKFDEYSLEGFLGILLKS